MPTPIIHPTTNTQKVNRIDMIKEFLGDRYEQWSNLVLEEAADQLLLSIFNK
jgi:hypothetical protein